MMMILILQIKILQNLQYEQSKDRTQCTWSMYMYNNNITTQEVTGTR